MNDKFVKFCLLKLKVKEKTYWQHNWSEGDISMENVQS